MRLAGLLAGALAALLLSACSGGVQATEPSIPATEETTEETAVVEMTEKEKDLFSEIWPMEERIREGRLFAYQEEALRSYRAGMDYLSEKYLGTEFETLSVSPATKFEPWMTVRIKSGDSGDWILKVDPQDGGYSCSDDYYNVLLREKYDLRLEEMLREEGTEARTFTIFTKPLTDVGPDTGIDELFSMSGEIPHITHLFILEQGDDGMAQEALERAGVFGAYILYFVPEGEMDLPVEGLEDQRLSMKSRTFNIR
ncbi:MAG: hypothetical protein IJT00_10530 [Lachnospiraceae bacterium]|nr:hypothetical protein [Lachnospiraceae bacterium]